jgi:uncharacterized protein
MSAGNPNVGNPFPNPNHLRELANYKMPFGKYKNQRLLHLPEAYFVWFQQKGFPNGKLGQMMQEMFEIKVNGLEGLLKPFVER